MCEMQKQFIESIFHCHEHYSLILFYEKIKEVTSNQNNKQKKKSYERLVHSVASHWELGEDE